MNILNKYAIFCEDIREEIGNKYSLVGVLPGALILPTFPFTIPKFGIVGSMELPIDFNMPAFSLQVLFYGADASRTVLFDQTMNVGGTGAAPPKALPEMSDEPDKLSIQAKIVLSPMTFGQQGRVRLEASFGDFQLTLGSIAVMPPTLP